MRQSLARGGETATLSLLDEVERFMLELANSPENLKPEDVRALRERIGSGSLLFKVRIIESNLRTCSNVAPFLPKCAAACAGAC